jgi:hypothetical protein
MGKRGMSGTVTNRGLFFSDHAAADRRWRARAPVTDDFSVNYNRISVSSLRYSSRAARAAPSRRIVRSQALRSSENQRHSRPFRLAAAALFSLNAAILTSPTNRTPEQNLRTCDPRSHFGSPYNSKGTPFRTTRALENIFEKIYRSSVCSCWRAARSNHGRGTDRPVSSVRSRKHRDQSACTI